jgi:predicted aconitase with swiveling domain
MSLARTGKQPSAIVLEKPADPNIVEGTILARIALVSEARALASRVPDGALVRVDGSTGEVVWEE